MAYTAMRRTELKLSNIMYHFFQSTVRGWFTVRLVNIFQIVSDALIICEKIKLNMW
jgi:hypothetical protein